MGGRGQLGEGRKQDQQTPPLLEWQQNERLRHSWTRSQDLFSAWFAR